MEQINISGYDNSCPILHLFENADVGWSIHLIKGTLFNKTILPAFE